MQKNVASQKWIVFAFDETDNTAKTGDAANITANIRLDGGAPNAVDDTNPTELEDGYYVFDITQAECNADLLSLHPASSTGDIQVIGVPGAVWTRPPAFNTFVLGDAAGTAATPAEVATALTTYDSPTKAEMDTAHALLATPAQVASELGTYDSPTKAEMDTAHALLATPAQVASELGTYDAPTKAEMDTAHALLATPAQVASELGTYDAPTKAEMDTAHALLPTAVENRQEMDSNSTELAKIGTIPALDGAGQTIGEAIAKLADDNGGASFDAALHSLKGIRDRGDTAWITGGGGGITDILSITSILPNSIDLANTATVRLQLGLINGLDDLPSTAEIDPGTIDIDRKAIGGTSWTSVVSGAACSELAGLIYYDEVFDSGTGYAANDSIRITFKDQKITVSGNDYEITGNAGWIYQTYIRTAAGTAGAGAITWTYTLTDSVAPNNPIADADVWVTSDIGGSNVIASGTTDQNGVVTFYLDAGVIYVWAQKSGWDFDNPDTETVS